VREKESMLVMPKDDGKRKILDKLEEAVLAREKKAAKEAKVSGNTNAERGERGEEQYAAHLIPSIAARDAMLKVIGEREFSLFDRLHIEFRFVHRYHRKKGFGSKLMDKMTSIAEESGCLLTTQVLRLEKHRKWYVKKKGFIDAAAAGAVN
jgi:GNAT superfamily N-acetyltransferase